MTRAITTFPPETLDAMFAAVEINDIVDPLVSLPDPVPVACSAQDMRESFDLCRRFWQRGAARTDMLALVSTLLAGGDLPADARLRYKHIRASYKQMRFALVLYGRRHKAPFLFRSTVALMGHLQDAFRNRRRMAVLGLGLVLRVLLSWPMWLAVQAEVGAVGLDDPTGFLAFRRAEIGRLRRWLDVGSLTAHRFHAMRKIVSRQVSFYDVRRTLAPAEDIVRTARFLAAINGLMGSVHDDLVEQAVRGQRDYNRDDFLLPADIEQRLRDLVRIYPG